MQVRDGMNRVVVTVGPEHTLREAARRMTTADVGAAVVIDPEAMGPGILTERDLLHSVGHDENPDAELVRDHLTQRLTYAAADWSLERAAEEMADARFRHVVVLDGSEVVGILSMRDIVRCWTRAGASSSTVRSSSQARSGNPIGSRALM
ncbi:MAG: CBS domain-containing protein [Solirubrobacteraceae bacterium]